MAINSEGRYELLSCTGNRGVYNLVKKKQNKYGDHEEVQVASTRQMHHGYRSVQKLAERFKKLKKKYSKKDFEGVHVKSFFNSSNASRRSQVKSEHLVKKKRELQRGMEILDLDFLLSIVEKIEGNDKNDMIMRKLCFDELFRRVRLDHINSQVLKVYAVNGDNIYGKDIQCEALKELADRTVHHSHKKDMEPALSISG
jgi:hypothetical protein